MARARGASRVGVWLVSLWLAGCGGGAPPAESAASEPAESAVAPADEPAAPADEAAEPAPTEEPAAPASAEEAPASEPVSAQTFQNALQAVIGDPTLLEALGIDPASSQPVVMAGADLPSGLERTAVIRRFEIVPVPTKPTKKRVLVFTKIELTAERGMFKYRIESTGAYGTTRVAYENGAWHLKSSRVSTP